MEVEEKLADRISMITPEDRILFEKYISETPTDKPGIKYENSFDYIYMYLNQGKFKGYKYMDKKTLLIFGITGKGSKRQTKFFKPLGSDRTRSTEVLIEYVTKLKKTNTKPITLACLSNERFNDIRRKIEVKKVKHFEYFLYDLEDINELKGTRWKNVRQKINTFQNNYPKVRVEDLSETNGKKVIHFISEWRRDAAARGFSYIDIDKNKDTTKYYQNIIDNKNIWGRVYYLNGKVEAFQFLFKLETTPELHACGHAIGMVNNNITGLSEYTQIDVWQFVKKYGIRYINDGPSWRPGLKRYKKKFNPCGIQQVIECIV
jgi:hypothetical protein